MARKRDRVFGRVQSVFIKFFLFFLLGIVVLITVVGVHTINAPIAVSQEKSTPITAQTTPQDLLALGINYYQQGRFMEALEVWQSAEKRFESQGNVLNQALTFNYLSLAHQQLNHWQPAQATLTQSETILKNYPNLKNSSQGLQILARIFTTKGRLLLTQGQPQQAWETWQQATNLYQQLGDQTGQVGSLINEAQALKAWGRYRQALKTLNTLKQDLNEETDPVLKVTSFLSLGNALQEAGDLDNAWCVLNETLNNQVKPLQNAALTADITLSFANTNVALAKQELEPTSRDENFEDLMVCSAETIIRYGEVKEFYQEASESYLDVLKNSNASPQTQLNAHLNYLSLLTFLDAKNSTASEKIAADLPSAREYLTTELPKIQDLINQLSSSLTAIYAQINLAKNLVQTGSNLEELAQQLLTTAYSQATETFQNKPAQVYALGALGWFYEQIGNYNNANQFTRQAFNESVTLNRPDLRYQWEWQRGRIAQATGDKVQAISYYEAAVDSLGEIRQNLIGIDQGLATITSFPNIQLPPFTSNLNINFREQVEPVYRQLVSLLLSETENEPVNPETINKALGVIELLQVAELENFLQCDVSSLEEAKNQQTLETARTVAEAQQKVKEKLTEVFKYDPNAAIIYPIILEDRLEVIRALPNQSLKHYSIAKTQDQVQSTIEKLNKALRERDNEAIWKDAFQVYSWLIQPLKDEIADKTLVFVLDIPLRNIPMAALHDQENKRSRYLIEDYPVASISSLQLLNLNTSKEKNLRALTAGVSKGREVQGIPFGDLSFVEQELKSIQGLLKDSKAFLNENFTQQTLQQQINSITFPIVHLATHGNFSSRRELTFLLDGVDTIDLDDLNRLLQASRFGKERIDLLVMSACQTAKGDRRAALGLAGVAVKAGVNSIVASLWAVSDQSTEQLMTEFYKQLLQPSMTKAKALHEAQKTLLKPLSNTRAPYYWSPFILIGNWL